MLILTVVSDFADYRRGDQITDAAKIADILKGDQHERVVKSEVPDAPAPEVKTSPAE